ncbi:MAG: type II secretion system protein GspG [Candidatus Aminicenantes bacterium]|nr:type II secretion system protein GspG [Candidatus Aminicenantes bacterium]
MKWIRGGAIGWTAAVFLLVAGCRNSTLDVARVENLLEDQSILIQKYIDGIQMAGKLEDVTARMQEYLDGIHRLTPDINLHLDTARRSGNTLTDPQKNALARMISLLRLMDFLVQMDLQRFGNHSRIAEMQTGLVEAYQQIDVSNLPVEEERIRQAYNDLLEGRIRGDGAMANLSRHMGRASLTSKLKITMRTIMQLGEAVDQYVAEYGVAPEVESINDLHLYPRFAAYFRDLILKDAWGNDFYYRADGARFWIASAGSDGEFQGFDQEGVYRDYSGRDLIFSGKRFVFWPDFRRS